jgi:outer membrane lipoprotein
MHSLIKKSVVVLTFTLFFSGCAMVPEPIEVSEDISLVTFNSVINGSETSQGSLARWGGEIVNVENKKEYSEIEVLHYPSNSFGKPRSTLNSEGRFKVRVAGFIDPLVFEKGRLITFLGEIGEPAKGIIGEQTYVYPLLLANGYYMWKETEEYEVSGFYYSPLSPYWSVGSRRHYWGGYGLYHNRATIRVKTKSSSSNRVKSKSRNVANERRQSVGNKTSQTTTPVARKTNEQQR